MTMFNLKKATLLAPGFHPDPSICRDDTGTYYMVHSSFEYFPGIPLLRSTDCLHWEQVGHVLTRPTQLPGNPGSSQGIYAPTLRFHDGMFYLVTTNVNVGNFLVTATDPAGQWSDPQWLKEWPGIDPSLFFDDDGSVYIQGSDTAAATGEQPGIYQAKIEVSTGKLLSERSLICPGITGTNPEGPHVFKRKGLYYLTWAEGGTEAGHMQNLAVADSPMGPYEMFPGNPMLTNRSTHLPLQAIGHCDVAELDDPDSVFLVFHGTRMEDHYPAHTWIGREPFGVVLPWKGRWPEISDQSYTFDAAEAEALAKAVGAAGADGAGSGADGASASSSSIGRALAEDWVTPGLNPGIEASGNHVVFGAGVSGLVGLRQTSFTSSLEADVTAVSETGSGSGAVEPEPSGGLIAYQNADHYIRLVLTGTDDEGLVRFEARNSSLVSVIATLPYSGARPRLALRGTEHGYVAGIADAQGSRELGFAPATILDLTNAGGFTGALLGLFVTASVASQEVHFDGINFRG
ncbi:MAG: glycoside hydrolase family 43 protein [Bifidobacteriaceae bacterium]|jgi:alpha-N-arabinofuranosidase|nr:glycoside hydrolase family 43 protein [Bifidobacteriaceae bacterium]